MGLNEETRSRFSPENLLDIVDTVQSLTAKNISSMRQDYMAGRRTEIRSINGYITAWKHSAHLQSPINDRIIELIENKVTIDQCDALSAAGFAECF